MKGMQYAVLLVAAAMTGPLLVSVMSIATIGSEQSECFQYAAPRSKVNRSVISESRYMYKVPETKQHKCEFSLFNRAIFILGLVNNTVSNE
jgi:hypothetical protein